MSVICHAIFYLNNCTSLSPPPPPSFFCYTHASLHIPNASRKKHNLFCLCIGIPDKLRRRLTSIRELASKMYPQPPPLLRLSLFFLPPASDIDISHSYHHAHSYGRYAQTNYTVQPKTAASTASETIHPSPRSQGENCCQSDRCHLRRYVVTFTPLGLAFHLLHSG